VVVCRAIVLGVCLVATCGAADATTVGVAWDANPEPTLTGYRVYVGTQPGVHTESFDVGSYQTTFLYTSAVSGRRYYFAVAALAQGTISPKSVEVSAVAGAEDEAVSATASARRESSGVAQNVASPATARIRPIASGLKEITSITGLPREGGVLVEEGARIWTFSDDGLSGLAHEAAPGTRIAAVAVDPRFATTGLLYAVEMQPGLGHDDVFVVRHRLLAGVLGEPAAVVSAGRQPAGTPVGLAVAPNGDVVLAQGPRVTLFRQDGGMIRSWPMALEFDGAGVRSGLAYDARRNGVWSAALGTALEVSFLRLGDDHPTVRMPVGESAGTGAIAVGVAVVDSAVAVGVASDTTAFRLDPTAARVSPGTTVTDWGTIVSLLPSGPDSDLVVVREPVNGGSSYALLQVRHAAVP
jgi:hypothetical protein